MYVVVYTIDIIYYIYTYMYICVDLGYVRILLDILMRYKWCAHDIYMK